MAEFDEITLTQVATFPRPGTAVPANFGFTPDSKAVTFLWSEEGSLVRSLHAMDVANGERRVLVAARSGSEEGLSLDERLRRERARQREVGVTSYQYAKKSDPAVLLVPMEGQLFVRRGEEELTAIPGTEGALDPRLTDDGSAVAFVRDGDLFACRIGVESGVARLTSDAEDGVTNGEAEFIAHEELGRSRGFWWSPDGARIAFVRADSRHIPKFPIVHQGGPMVEVEEHRYPFAGEPNARLRLGVAVAGGGETVWMDLGDDEDIYIGRVAWRPDGSLAALLLNRAQTEMTWLAFDVDSGVARRLFTETGEPWVNLSNDTRFLESGEILVSSERETGFRHLWLLRASGEPIRALTRGSWMVTRLIDVDEERRVACFQATKGSPLRRRVFTVLLDGGEVALLPGAEGWLDAVFAPDHRRYISRWSSLGHAPVFVLREVDSDRTTTLFANEGADARTLGLLPPTCVEVSAPDGTTLLGAIYQPPPGAFAGPRPAIVSVYGGPHAQRVIDEWSLTVDLRAQHFARRGYVVLMLDNRGSANRGLAFEAAISRRCGTVEVEDQIAGAKHLASRPNVDPDRIGVYGWSYGGYMTLLLMMKAPEIFRAGVAGAPVTDWDGYDTGYTERYMGTPQENPEGYREGSVLTHVDRLEGDLLLIHGMIDENVHFRHTGRLLTELARANRRAELLALPAERHMPRDHAGLLYLETRIFEFFERTLGAGASGP
jgi:dipeptidyl-peptidase-4